MRANSLLLIEFLPLMVGFATLLFLAWYGDQIARRLEPELAPHTRFTSPRPAPVGLLNWAIYFGKGLVVALLLLAFIRGPALVGYAVLAWLTLSLLYFSYVRRIRPLVRKGATRTETAVLVSVVLVWAASWAWFLCRFLGRAHGAG